jgi:hypothetical protein
MTTPEIRAELSMKRMEFEKAKDLGLPHSHLMAIYRNIKELQYQLALASLSETQASKQTTSDRLIE